jgi:predicted metalloprotease with PDZ domain
MPILTRLVPMASSASVLLSCVSGTAAGPPQPPAAPITLRLDASDAPARIVRIREVIPVRPGALTLYFPKWIPGTGGPSDVLGNLAGLRLSALGKPVAWQRDNVDLYSFHCDVPPGASALEVELDENLPFSLPDWVSASTQVASLDWQLLYPKGVRTDALTVAASVVLPHGWQAGTALRVAARTGDQIAYEPVSLTTLIDSPLVAGAHFRSIPLEPGPVPIWLDVAADSDAALGISDAELARHRRLFAEAQALFGARHYKSFHELFVLSDRVHGCALEHHESYRICAPERLFLDDAVYVGVADVFAHEVSHSWTGKYRRPAGLTAPDFNQTLLHDLQWVYEGLTHYVGNYVLAARSGLISPSDFTDRLAIYAARLAAQPGRTWRPIADLAVGSAAPDGPAEGLSRHRFGHELYMEGALVWLEADVLIRRESGGRRSLDDFLRAFFGGGSDGPPNVVPYTLDELLAALDHVHHHDWKAFFGERIERPNPRAPLGGVEGGGWRLSFEETPSELWKKQARTADQANYRYSLGFLVRPDGTVGELLPESPAGKAGLLPTMKILAVNGRRFVPRSLPDAIRSAKTSAEPIELLVEDGDFFRTLRVPYQGGERYPHLVRDPSVPNVLAAIMAPRATAPASAPSAP